VALETWIAHKERPPSAPERMSPLPDFTLTAVTPAGSETITRKDLLGRMWVADFIYTRCAGPCPFLSARMGELQKDLPGSVRLVSFTVDPDHDTITVLREYARRWKAEEGRWLFVTGTKAPLFRLMQEGFHLPVAQDSQGPEGLSVTHSAKFVLVDANGVIRDYYDGNDPAGLEALRRDTRRFFNHD
jgi:protein SCO1/2